MWKWAVIGWILLKLCVAAPPLHIDRLALFPDKSAWCEAKNITQIIGHTGCQPHSIQNRACLGQCFSYSVPNTFPQLTESLVHCDSCMPVQMQWEVVTLACPGNKEMPYVDKLVERILQCSCQSCDKEAGQQGALLQLFPSDATPEPPARGNEGRTHGRPGAHAQHAHAQHPHAHAQHANVHAQHPHAHAQHAHTQHPHAHAQHANVHAQHAHAHPDSHPHPHKPAGG